MPGRVTIGYLLVGLLWIALSDRAVEWLAAGQPAVLATLQTWKGVFYVLATAALLYVVLRGWAGRHAAAARQRDAHAAETRDLFRLAPIPMWVSDGQGTILDVNEAALRAFGHTREALLGGNSDVLRDPVESERVRAFRAAPPPAPPPWRAGVFRHVTRSGGRLDAEVFVSPVRWGAQDANLTALHDLTELQAAERRLRETESTFNELLGAMNEVVWITDAQQRSLLYLSPAAERLTGYTAAELVGRTDLWAELVLPEDLPMVAKVLGGSGSGEAFTDTLRVRHRDGSVRWVEVSGVLVVDQSGRPHRHVGIAADVTQSRAEQAERRLADQVFHHAREGILITDPAQRILRVNPSFTQITGYGAAEVLGQTPRMFASGQHGPEFYAEMWRALERDGYWQGEVWNRTKAGEVYLEGLSITAIRDEAGNVNHYMGVFTDITTARRSEVRIHHLVNYDAVTGLPNRALFEERINACCERPTDDCGCGVVILGLDRFKDINDSLGREVGDRILAELAERLRTHLDNGDGLARLHGDVFAVHVTAGEHALATAERVLTAVNAPFDGPDGDMHLTASAGVARFPEHGRSATELLRLAEVAMFQAKRMGRGKAVTFEPQLEKSVSERLALELRLRRALQRDELELHYQPQVALRSQGVAGVEALARWSGPQGPISPGVFVPIAEETGLILELGRWVLHRACRDARAWLDSPGGPVRVAVNISAQQFRQPDFVGMVAQALADTGLPADWLELEVTEGVVMDGADRVRATLEELRRLGVHLSIDDFGTGYSSLAYLRRFPIDKLKIDQSFIREMLHDADAAAVTHAIVELAKTLRLGVIAEGVETEEQAAFLATIGCDEAQGWLYAKAMPAATFLTWRDARHPRARSA